MEIVIPSKFVKTVAKEHDEVQKYLDSQPDRQRIKITSAEKLTPSCLKAFRSLFKEESADGPYVDDVQFLLMIRKNPSKVEVDNCRKLADSLPAYFAEDIIKGWVFERGPYGALIPYCLMSVEFHPARRRDYSFDQVIMTLAYADSTSLEINDNRVSWSEQVFIANYKEIYVDGEVDEEDDEDDDGDDTKESARAREIREAKKEARRKKARRFQLLKLDELLAQKNLVKETKELHDEYEAQLERFLKLINRYGKQLLARGSGIDETRDDNSYARRNRRRGGFYSYYSRNYSVSMYVDGKPAKVICDHKIANTTEDKEEGEGKYLDPTGLAIADLLVPMTRESPTIFAAKKIDEVNIRWEAPLHPYIRIYHLETEADCSVHCMNLRPYVYKQDLIDKLILPDEVKNLVTMMTSEKLIEVEDIVEDKSQATTIACLGDPGLGKTLTAEVIAERVGKPLYKVQAATLGLTAEELETNLKRIMDRSQEWDTVLLLDEANAYVHSRGHDILQNAIVGVFLRLIESYRGILILTTNLVTAEGKDDIDDAILSRCNAVIHYSIPNPEDSFKIWRDQRAVRKIKADDLSDELLHKLSKTFRISGRTIRNVLGNVARYCKSNKLPMSYENFVSLSKYTAITRSETLPKVKGSDDA